MIGNAAVAAVLALAALAVGCACRSPAVRHAAWVLVLLKLLTPPLFDVPLTVLPASWATPPAEPAAGRVIRITHPAADPGLTQADAVPPTPSRWDGFGPDDVIDWLIVAWAVG